MQVPPQVSPETHSHGSVNGRGLTSHRQGTPMSTPADPATAKKLLNSMKRPIGSLAVRDDPYRFIEGNLKVTQASFDGLRGHTMQVALLGGEVGTSQEINDLRQQMRDQDQRQKEGIEEIQHILNDMLQNQVVASMRQQVQQEIIDQIDGLVKEHIAECLKVHIPQDLQDDVEDSKRELREVRQALHNSESRRANANLRSNKPDSILNTIYMANGNISKYFPKDLQGLFSLDDASCKFLMEEYELPHQSESRDLNLNRLMQFFGVRYQLIRRAAEDSVAA